MSAFLLLQIAPEDAGRGACRIASSFELTFATALAMLFSSDGANHSDARVVTGNFFFTPSVEAVIVATMPAELKREAGEKREAAAETGAAAATPEPTTAKEAEQRPEETPQDDEDDEGEETGPAAGEQKKKKKKKKKKSGSSGGGDKGVVQPGAAAVAAAKRQSEENSKILRRVKEWTSFSDKQTWPPTKPMHQIFTDGLYPEGELRETKRKTAAEDREAVRLEAVDIQAMRQASECHRQVRRYIQGIARPGVKLIDLCQTLEAKTKELVDAYKLDRGWGFPTGCSLNHCAAHYTPNPGDNRVLEQGDICKLDFGVQVGGRIIDCAFTIAFDEKFDTLIQATQDGTNVGISHAGADARLSEIGGYIQEAIESYEMEIDGKMVPIKPIRNLTGHSIDLYRIHAGKAVPIVKAASGQMSNAPTNFMEEGEVYAIETFASTGRGHVTEEGECSHYMKDANAHFAALRLKSAKDLLKVIEENFGTLAFCRRWLEDLGCPHHLLALKQLVEKQIIVPYPPLSDVKGSFTSQMEHTIFIGRQSVEVVSRGDDF
ncbi:putative methionine aminopeptidase 2 [Besnoitia besnoiti]|uniref:Methionine aminopeptidase 2 n=1 Tax=Besnoitia besnoiti TaxID=94643 RepID=A0A2A9MA09_BESBE|nr:putative methionine aminopeptidase 2 [Besnoitia besnoiti]PFH32447.1 putative methionine aminopeptidase 2 [Besnoitia besnoiti]